MGTGGPCLRTGAPQQARHGLARSLTEAPCTVPSGPPGVSGSRRAVAMPPSLRSGNAGKERGRQGMSGRRRIGPRSPGVGREGCPESWVRRGRPRRRSHGLPVLFCCWRLPLRDAAPASSPQPQRWPVQAAGRGDAAPVAPAAALLLSEPSGDRRGAGVSTDRCSGRRSCRRPGPWAPDWAGRQREADPAARHPAAAPLRASPDGLPGCR